MQVRLLCAALALATAVPADALAADAFTLGIGADYSTGQYGGDISTEILSVPVTARLDAGNWSLRASLPWVRVSGDPNVLPTVGPVDNLNPFGRGRTGLVDPITGGPDPGTDPGTGETTQEGTASGVGDLALAASYAIPTNGDWGLDLGVNAKIATADEDKGLGTGANDYGASVDAYRDFDGTMLFGGVGRVWLGSSDYIDAESVNTANLGVSQAVGEGRIGVMYDFRGASASGFDDRRDLIGFYNRGTASGGRFQFYVSRGLTDGSPDWGAGLALSTGFE